MTADDDDRPNADRRDGAVRGLAGSTVAAPRGLAVLGAGLAGFLALGLPWYLFAVLLLVPDVSAAGYLRGPRVGAIVYNVVHDLFTGAAIAGVGLALGSVPVMAVGAVLVAHSGMDRVAGYGLKLPTSFQDTHSRPHRTARGVAQSYRRSRCHVPATRSR